MVKFIKENELNQELSHLMERAEDKIILISPFIKLHDRFKSILINQTKNPKLKIIIVFGKNDGNYSKSMNKEDFEFFKGFPNIQIRYEKRLHAKYYANESVSILTSMNLYGYSQNNNIEVGVLTKATLLSNIANKVTDDDFDKSLNHYFERVIEQSDLLFEKIPLFDKGTLGMGLNKKYKGSIVQRDKLSSFYSIDKNNETNTQETSFFGNSKNEKAFENKRKHYGYCIRTGVEIPFNIDKPLSYEAYKSWRIYEDGDYPEKYCHFSGEPSYGQTSVNRPILKKNWNKARDMFDF